MNKYITKSGDTVDYIAWKFYGPTGQMVEMLLDDNPGLAAIGPALPEGLEIYLPPKPESQGVKVVKLWD